MITLPADGLEPINAEPSAGLVLTQQTYLQGFISHHWFEMIFSTKDYDLQVLFTLFFMLL